MATPPTPRFLPLAEVADVLSISVAQVYALVRRGDLPAIKIGGRGQWRVEASELEDYISRMYADTRDFISRHPYAGPDAEPGADDASDTVDMDAADTEGTVR